MDANKEFDKLLKHINSTIKNQSGKCSAIARQIMFGLTTAIWAIFIIDDEFDFHFLIAFALLACIVYFIIDFWQYLYITYAYKNLHTDINKVLEQFKESEVGDKLKKSLKNALGQVSETSFTLFFWKLPFVILAFLGISSYVILKIYLNW